jgi:DNA-binding NarL/FixJ family response regulator
MARRPNETPTPPTESQPAPNQSRPLDPLFRAMMGARRTGGMGILIRVLLANEIPLIGNVLAAVLEDEYDIDVVASVDSMEEAVSEAPGCDVVLVSTSLGEQGALQTTRTLTERLPHVRVLVVGLTESRNDILPYIQAGAVGYVLKEDSVEELVRRIRAAAQERALISPEMAVVLMERVAELAQMLPEVPTGSDGHSHLTPRQYEILQLIGQGLSNQEIADELTIEVGTVKNHVHTILQKLQVKSRNEALMHLTGRE